jgi:multicomponent Na+:H+ antiporter subunit D
MPDQISLFVLVPLAAAFVSLLVKTRLPRLPSRLTLVSSLVLLVLSVGALATQARQVTFAGGWAPVTEALQTFVPGVALVLDGLSALVLTMVAVVGLAVTVYGARYLEGDEGRPLFFVLFNLLVVGMNGAVLAGDLFNLYVFIEIASIASYALVAFGTGAREIEAAFKYLLLGAVASLALLLGIGVLYRAAGVLNFADLSLAIAEGQVPASALQLVAGLFLAGFAIKAAMMPFHAWLPDAHASAPAPISAMLSGLLIKTLGIYALVRVFYVVLGMGGPVGESLQTLLLVFGCLSMVGGVLLALGQDDVKRLLAYSSISQMGFVLVALGTNTWLGVVAALFHALNHALFKSALFLSSGSLERLTGTRRLSEMGGLLKLAPATSLGAMGACLSIAGVPPFNGFWSKLLILVALFEAGLPLVGGLAAATAVLTLLAVLKIQRQAFFGPLPERLVGVREVPAAMHVPVLALSLLCLALGVLWPFGVDDVVHAAARAVRSPETLNMAPAEYQALVHDAPVERSRP